jgi:hypothetical protein
LSGSLGMEARNLAEPGATPTRIKGATPVLLRN